MLSMETKTQQAPGNAQVVPNQNNPGQASADNTAQTAHTGVGDWQEETYQMIKSLKDQYFAELSELFNKLCVKLQHVDSIVSPKEPTEQYERMKSFKIMLERILQILQISKGTIQPALKGKVPQYEKQIISILNSQRKPVQPQVQQQFLQVQMNPYKASADCTAQIGHTGAGDWQEEIYQMIKSLKDQYFAELSELFNKLCVKLQHVDSIISPKEPTEQYERMKSFKIMLERILQILQISKDTIQPDLKGKVPQYEKQIISILNSQRKPVQPQVQQQFLQVQMNPYKASADCTAQIGHAGAGDWQEEIYQMIMSLKDQYFAELSELFNKLCVKLQHVDSVIPPKEPSEMYERMKSFKIMLERILQILQIRKSNIQSSLRDKLPQYEKQIISILNSQRKPVQPQVQQPFQPPAGQAPNSIISQQRQPPQSLQQHGSHTNPQASLSSMSTGLQSSSAAGIQHVPAPPTIFSVPTQRNGANIQRQVGSNMEAAEGSNFNSLQYGLMGGTLRRGSTGPTMNAQPQTGSSTLLSHLSGQRKHMTKRRWRDTF